MTDSLEIGAVHIALAVLLFFLMNWIGQHSIVTARYFQLSYFGEKEEAPAFNIVFRCLAPVVYLILVSSVIYAVGMGQYVHGIYWVVVYQILGRWAYNLLWGRRLLLRWARQVVLATITVALALVTYNELLIDPARLLPDAGQMRDQLWIVIVLFLYKLWDSAEKPQGTNDAQRRRYLRARYQALSARYGHVISEQTNDRAVKLLIYAVLIYEGFNRPSFVRWIECHVLFRLGHARSLGPMQVQTSTPITDIESVRTGAQLLARSYSDALPLAMKKYSTSAKDPNDLSPELREFIKRHAVHDAATAAAASFNVRSDYAREVRSIIDYLDDVCFPCDEASTSQLKTATASH